MAYSANIREEQLKNMVAHDWFGAFDTTKIIGNIDFCIAVPDNGGELFDQEYFLWAESKAGVKDIYESFVQLILTIGKARTFDRHLPPAFLGAFDTEKIAFLPYNKVMDVFEQNDFNWNVTPSDHLSKEFLQLHHIVWESLEKETLLYYFDANAQELREFIRRNFVVGRDTVSKVRINKNNFTHIYRKWLGEVKPSIDINWEEAKKEGLLDADFYLADILSNDNKSIKESLYVLLETDKYRYNIHRKATGSLVFEEVQFNDGQKAHNRFWMRYSRPPKEEYWDYIEGRRDLLVPQDIRERKGSYFTPVQWVELSQEYIARELGEDWQDEYYVWDCCAGTGNLLAGLTNKYNIYASTLDAADVRVMKELIHSNSINLLENHVFQFDFLNDDFSRLPPSLLDIVNDPEKRKKLVIYINPPYAEAGNVRQRAGTGVNKDGTAIVHATYSRYKEEIKQAASELFAQFFYRIYKEICGCMLAEFSKLKILQAPNFKDFREHFRAHLCNLFLVPANTFDNVKGQFPIGFFIWNTGRKEIFKSIEADIYDSNGDLLCKKNICATDNSIPISRWLMKYNTNSDNYICLGSLNSGRNDFQNQGLVYIANYISSEKSHAAIFRFREYNFQVGTCFFAVRHCIEATWLNDRDQFLYPNDSWKEDEEFQNDCLAYTLFHGQNRISSAGGTNHWIPFTEEEVGAKERFESHFMSEYIQGKRRPSKIAAEPDLFAAQENEVPIGNGNSDEWGATNGAANNGTATNTTADNEATENKTDNGNADNGTATNKTLNNDLATDRTDKNESAENGTVKNGNADNEATSGTAKATEDKPKAIVFSPEAQAVMDAGRELWRYYHSQPKANPNASFYDIRLHFQGTNDKGKMNPDSTDAEYTRLIKELRSRLRALAAKLAPKVYLHRFLLS